MEDAGDEQYDARPDRDAAGLRLRRERDAVGIATSQTNLSRRPRQGPYLSLTSRGRNLSGARSVRRRAAFNAELRKYANADLSHRSNATDT